MPRDHSNRIGPKRFRVLGIDIFAGPFAECVLLDSDDYFDAIRVATMKANKFFPTHLPVRLVPPAIWSPHSRNDSRNIP